MTLDTIREFIEPRRVLLDSWLKEDPRRKYAILGLVFFLSIYILSLGGEKASYVFKDSGATDFDTKNLIENPYKTIYDGKVGVLEETKNRLVLENRKLRQEIEGLKVDFKDFMSTMKKDLAAQRSNDAESKEDLVASASGPSDSVNFQPGGLQGMKANGLSQEGEKAVGPPEVKKFAKKKKKRSKNKVFFPVKLESKEEEAGIVIGVGSWAKGTIIAGAEIPQSKTYPIVIQLDQAFSMANQTRISLVGCLMVAKAMPEMATRHVEIQPESMACFNKSGRYFERKINGWGSDSLDNNFGVKGLFKSNISRFAEYSFIKSMLDGVGEIVKRKSQNFGGQDPNRPDILLQDGGTQTASQVTEFLMNQARQLLPTLEISSGREVYITMKESVRLPYEFFDGNGEENEEFSYSFDVLR